MIKGQMLRIEDFER